MSLLTDVQKLNNTSLCVVSHDAGGAEILASYVVRNSLSCIYVLDGPAIRVFERKLGNVAISSIEDAITCCDNFLCGTSWQSDLEWQTIAMVKKANKRSVAFLDHWVNYRERFIRNGEEYLPDELWVGDTEAHVMATHLFPSIPVRYVDNPYFLDLREELVKLSKAVKRNKQSTNILYVCEPLREHALREYGDERYWGYTEEEALRYFLANIKALGVPVKRVVIRPHPSEQKNKYDWAFQEFNLPLVRGGTKTLFEEVVESDIVVGCESMAMVIGMQANRRVVTCIPPGGKPCALPQTNIESLQQLILSKSS